MENSKLSPKHLDMLHDLVQDYSLSTILQGVVALRDEQQNQVQTDSVKGGYSSGDIEAANIFDVGTNYLVALASQVEQAEKDEIL